MSAYTDCPHGERAGAICPVCGLVTAGHTPGPWERDEITDTVFGASYLYDSMGDAYQVIVADCAPRGGPPVDEQTANARLIAAAPEMAEFIRDLLEHDGKADDFSIRFAEDRERGRAILRKAGVR